MTTYTIAIGDGTGTLLDGYYGLYPEVPGYIPALGSVSPEGGAVYGFVWNADGSDIQIAAVPVTADLTVTWLGHDYVCTYDGDGYAQYTGAGLGGPYPTSGTTTFSIGGAGAIPGTLSGVDGADAAAATGAVIVSGTTSGTDGADLASATSGIPPVTGALAAVDGADAATIAGAVLVTGALSATDGADRASITQGILQVGGHFPSIYIKQKRQPEQPSQRAEIRAAIEAAFDGPLPPITDAPPVVAAPPIDPMPAIIEMIMRAQAEAQSRIDADDEDAIAILAMVDDGDRRSVMQALHAIGVI